MLTKEYKMAYKEVIEILKHVPEDDVQKIPKEKIEFYKNNMDKDYVFIINPKIDLSEQNVSQEAKAVIVNLYRDHFATEKEKVKIKEILDLNQRKERRIRKYNR